MKQRINLYQASLYPVRHTYSLQRMGLAAMILLVLFGAVWLGLANQLTEVEKQVNIVKQQLSQQEQAVGIYQQALQQRKPNASLVAQFEQAQRDVIKLQQLQQYLTIRQQQASQFYSPVLQHLNTVNPPSLWLTSFQLQQKQSSFDGIALQPVSVTTWLEQLRQLEYFTGQDFSQVMMSQVPDNTAVRFVLSGQEEVKL